MKGCIGGLRLLLLLLAKKEFDKVTAVKYTDKEKKTVYDLLMDIDPTRQNTYEAINK
jgi:hypothetical protein